MAYILGYRDTDRVLIIQDYDKEGTLRLTRPFKTHLIGSLGTLTCMNYTAKTSFHAVALY